MVSISQTHRFLSPFLNVIDMKHQYWQNSTYFIGYRTIQFMQNICTSTSIVSFMYDDSRCIWHSFEVNTYAFLSVLVIECRAKHSTAQHSRAIVLSLELTEHFMQNWFKFMNERMVPRIIHSQRTNDNICNWESNRYKSKANEFDISCRCFWEWWYRFFDDYIIVKVMVGKLSLLSSFYIRSGALYPKANTLCLSLFASSKISLRQFFLYWMTIQLTVTANIAKVTQWKYAYRLMHCMKELHSFEQ